MTKSLYKSAADLFAEAMPGWREPLRPSKRCGPGQLFGFGLQFPTLHRSIRAHAVTIGTGRNQATHANTKQTLAVQTQRSPHLSCATNGLNSEVSLTPRVKGQNELQNGRGERTSGAHKSPESLLGRNDTNDKVHYARKTAGNSNLLDLVASSNK